MWNSKMQVLGQQHGSALDSPIHPESLQQSVKTILRGQSIDIMGGGGGGGAFIR